MSKDDVALLQELEEEVERIESKKTVITGKMYRNLKRENGALKRQLDIFKPDTTGRVCPKCNGNLYHINHRYDEANWACDDCHTKFVVPKIYAWYNIREVKNNG